ncbi:sigma-54-dependent Fis family transcriptional regulator, partial [Thioclava sp. BHET1]
NALLRHELRATGVWRAQRNQLVGTSPQIEAMRQMLARVADMPTPVLIGGESGTGKEVAARHLHALSARAARPFVTINCAALSAEALEEELYGPSGEGGLLASARGGTLFFDAIGEMPAQAQLTLVQLLESRGRGGLGVEATGPRDLRFLFASARALSEEVAAGRFREDLFFRINVVDLQMPPLRQRGSDVLDLAELFMAELATQLGLAPMALTGAARAAMLRHSWPGNIRELLNFIERALIFDRFPLEMLRAPALSEIEPLDSLERRHILRALEAAGGNRSEAARRLGISRKTIDRKCATWGL